MAIEIVNLSPEGFKTYGNNVIGYVKNNKLYMNSPELRIMVETEEQATELAAVLPPGTKFFLAGGQTMWQSGADGTTTKNDMTGTFYIDPETMNLYYDPTEV